jgi:PAS domain S-box-containing protein
MAQSSKRPPQWIRIAPEGFDVGVITTDLENRILLLNGEAERITGWSHGEASGRSLSAVLRTAGVRSGSAILARKDGTEIAIRTIEAKLCNENGEADGVAVFLRAASDERATDEAMGHQEEVYRSLVAGIKDYAIFMLDPGGIISTWNAGAERIKGYRKEEIVGKHFSIFYGPEALRSGWPQRELEHAKRDGHFEDEGWRVRKDGSRFWASVVITAIRDAKGSLKGFGKITRDLTQKMRQETELRDSELRYRRLFESARDAILILDAETGVVLESNPQMSELFGYGRHELFGRVLWETPLLADPDSRREVLGQLQREGARGSADVVLRARDGANILVELLSTTYRVGEGLLIQCSLRDNREKRQLVQAMVEAQALADLNRRKDEFLAMLSHELRNPLSPIVNALHLLKLGKVDPALGEQARTIIERQTAQLSRLVDDLLDVSRINTGRIRLQKDHVDLRDVVERAGEATRSLMEERHHHLEIRVPAEPVWVLADRTRIEQVLGNLLTNAAKYTPDGGRISVVLEEREGKAVTAVADNGIGIPATLLPRVFELFTQGERDSDRRLGGLGVGLTVVHKVVEMHGGEVEARSGGPGAGSEFVVTLPVDAPPSDQRLPFAQKATPPRPRKLKVLVVDDNEDTTSTVATILRHAGHDVQSAHSGQAALVAALAFHPAVVILDLGLPGMDGYEVARRIRENPDFEKVRIIAVSGYAQESDRKRSKEAGVDVHLAKPVEPDRIQEILAGLT